jgi:CheY-like chemotaxis protein
MSEGVLLIDDDDDLREVLVDLLSSSGIGVTAFADAREALTALHAGLDPSVILLDLMMPGMSGWEFREAQQRDTALARIPVVVVTAAPTLADGDHEMKGVESLRKPFTLDMLIDTVKKYSERDAAP